MLRESISDEFDVESLLDTDDALSFRRPGIGPDVVRKLRRGVWAIQGQLDLHGLRRDAARERSPPSCATPNAHGLRCVRVVHGKGNGSPGREPVLKGKVRSWLVQRSEVLAFVQARATEGGSGALVVLLRPRERPRSLEVCAGSGGPVPIPFREISYSLHRDRTTASIATVSQSTARRCAQAEGRGARTE